MFKAIFSFLLFSTAAWADSVCTNFPGLRIPIILGYHDIMPDKIGNSSDLTLDEFKAQIEGLQAKGYKFASLEEFYQLASNRMNLPTKTIVLTFDDGYDGQWAAYKFLEEKKIPASFFAITKHVGVPTSRKNMTWEQLREIDRSPLFSVHSHTVSHPDLREVTDAKKIQSEVEDSAHELRTQLERPAQQPMFLAYPNGSIDIRGSKLTAPHYEMAFGYTTEPVISTDPAYDSSFDVRIDPCLQIPRFTVGQRFKDTEDLVKAFPAFAEELRIYERMTSQYQRERRNYMRNFSRGAEAIKTSREENLDQAHLASEPQTAVH